MKDFINWIIGLPNCIKGGICNYNDEIQYTLSSKKFFQKSNRFSCNKCGKETAKYITF